MYTSQRARPVSTDPLILGQMGRPGCGAGVGVWERATRTPNFFGDVANTTVLYILGMRLLKGPLRVLGYCFIGVPYRIRTGVAAVRGRCPGPLDEGDEGCSVNSGWRSGNQVHGMGVAQSRKLTYCKGCSILRPRASVIAACRSSRFFPTTRSSSP